MKVEDSSYISPRLYIWGGKGLASIGRHCLVGLQCWGNVKGQVLWGHL